MTNPRHTYKVLGRSFDNHDQAWAFAHDRANATGQSITIMRGHEQWTAPWVYAIVTPTENSNTIGKL